MFDFVRRYPGAVLLAVLVHVLVVGVLLFSLADSPAPLNAPPQVEIVKATAVDEAQVQQEVDALRAKERTRAEALERERREAEQAAQAKQREQQQLAELRKQREAEQKRQAEQERQRKAEQAREQKAEQQRLAKLKAEQDALEKKRRAEEQRLAEIEAKRKEEARQRAEADAKRKEEERQRAEAEAKRQAEEERRRAEEAERQRLAAEQKRKEEEAARAQREREEALKRELAAEDQRLSQVREAQRQSEVDRYKNLIKAQVERRWTVPTNAQAGTICHVEVNLIPSGDVVGVRVKQCGGDAAFERSVVNAVHKASPLPVPPADSGLFDTFRKLDLPFEYRRK